MKQSIQDNFVERLEAHPTLKSRFESILDLAENTSGHVIVDFGADHAFGSKPEKLKEHYGITISTSTIQTLTEKHANQMH